MLAWTGVSDRLWERLAPGMDRLRPAPDRPAEPRRLQDYFALTPLSLTEATGFGPFRIEARPTLHHVPTTALRISAGGRTLGYSADTCFDPSLIDWLASADLVVHETNLGTHTPLADLAGLPAPLRARMRLVHYPDFFDVEASPIRCLAQGESIEILPAPEAESAG